MTPPLYAYRAGRLLDDGDPRAQFVKPVVIDHGNTSHPARRNHWNSHLDRHSSATPASAAFRFMGATTTWRQLHDRVCGLADAMARRGIGFGDRVIVLMTNRPEFMETVLAANRLGAIAVPVNFRFSVPEVSYIVENSASDLLVTDVALRHPSLRCVSTAGTSSGWAELYDELLTEPGRRAAPVDVPE